MTTTRPVISTNSLCQKISLDILSATEPQASNSALSSHGQSKPTAIMAVSIPFKHTVDSSSWCKRTAHGVSKPSISCRANSGDYLCIKLIHYYPAADYGIYVARPKQLIYIAASAICVPKSSVSRPTSESAVSAADRSSTAI